LQKTVVISGGGLDIIAEKIAAGLNAELIRPVLRVFPDGEHYIRIEDTSNVKDSCIVLVDTMYPWQNDSLLRILMIHDAVWRLGARCIVDFIPYLAYARQDKIFLEGEPVTGELVLNLLTRGVKNLVVVDIHSRRLLTSRENVLNLLFFDKLVSKIITDNNVEDPIIISPDTGALHRAEYAARRLKLEYDYLVKHRDRITGQVTLEPKRLNVRGRDVVIVDDIISTGGTIAKAARMLLEQGANEVYVAASHALLVGNALEKILSSGVRKIYTLQTLGVRHRPPVTYVDYSAEAASTIRSLVGI
jgi:ribose-phosphate pyrophosphokinase